MLLRPPILLVHIQPRRGTPTTPTESEYRLLLRRAREEHPFYAQPRSMSRILCMQSFDMLAFRPTFSPLDTLILEDLRSSYYALVRLQAQLLFEELLELVTLQLAANAYDGDYPNN